MAKTTKRTVRKPRKAKQARLPLPQAARDFIGGYGPLRDAVALCRNLPSNDRKEGAAVEAVRQAADAAERAYVRAAAEKHIGKIYVVGDSSWKSIHIAEPRPLHTLDEIVMAAVIAGTSTSLAQEMHFGILKAAGVNYERDLWQRYGRPKKKKAKGRRK